MKDPYGVLDGEDIPRLLAQAREAIVAQQPRQERTLGQQLDETCDDFPVLGADVLWGELERSKRRSRRSHNREVTAYMKRVCARLQIPLDMPQFEHISRMAADLSWFTGDSVNYPAFIVNFSRTVGWPPEIATAVLPHLPRSKAAAKKADEAFKRWWSYAIASEKQEIPTAHQTASCTALEHARQSGR